MQKDKMPRCRRDAMFCRKIQQGDEHAAHLLCREKRALIERAIRKFPANPVVLLDREDLQQAGYAGLLLAAHYFDPQQKTEFSCYAYRIIWQEMNLTVRQADTRILITQKTGKRFMHMLHVLENLQQRGIPLETRTRLLKLASKTDQFCEYNDFHRYLALYERPLSLDRARAEENWLTLQDLIPDKKNENVSDRVCQQAMKDHVHRIIRRLKPRSQDIICRHFGLGGRPRETCADIARSYHLTRERVRQIVNEELARLKAYIMGPLSRPLVKILSVSPGELS